MKGLSEAKYFIDQVDQIIAEQRKEIERLEAERRRMDVKMQVKDIAEFLGVTPQTVHNRLNDGRLKSKRMIDVLEHQKRR